MTCPDTLVITGCNRGIGLGMLVHAVDVWPGPVLATCRSQEALDALQSRFAGAKQVRVMRMDVQDALSIRRVAQSLGRDPVGCLINNAGCYPRFDKPEGSMQPFEQAFACNALGALQTTLALQHALKAAEKALCLHISSQLGSIARASGSVSGLPYAMSKAALNMMTAQLAQSADFQGVHQLCVHPGWVQTDMGGQQATLTVAQSVDALWQLVSNYQRYANGSFINYDGSPMPW